MLWNPLQPTSGGHVCDVDICPQYAEDACERNVRTQHPCLHCAMRAYARSYCSKFCYINEVCVTLDCNPSQSKKRIPSFSNKYTYE